MGISYFKNEKWENITRDERYFCFKLYENLNQNILPFLDLLKKGCNTKDKGIIKILKNIQNINFDVGVEVCFYRDLLCNYGTKVADVKKISNKKTFDLALFSEDYIFIIEAKAQQNFGGKQLEEFKKDKEQIDLLFQAIGKKTPEILLVGLYSSKYSPKKKTLSVFDFVIKWYQLAAIKNYNKPCFERANKIYNDSCEK